MASIRQRGNRWQCRVTRHGFPPETKSFATKADAETWARSIEVEMDKGVHQNRASVERTTLADILLRYAEEVTPCKKGAKDEAIRLNACGQTSSPSIHWQTSAPQRWRSSATSV